MYIYDKCSIKKQNFHFKMSESYSSFTFNHRTTIGEDPYDFAIGSRDLERLLPIYNYVRIEHIDVPPNYKLFGVNGGKFILFLSLDKENDEISYPEIGLCDASGLSYITDNTDIIKKIMTDVDNTLFEEVMKWTNIYYRLCIDNISSGPYVNIFLRLVEWAVLKSSENQCYNIWLKMKNRDVEPTISDIQTIWDCAGYSDYFLNGKSDMKKFYEKLVKFKWRDIDQIEWDRNTLSFKHTVSPIVNSLTLSALNYYHPDPLKPMVEHNALIDVLGLPDDGSPVSFSFTQQHPPWRASHRTNMCLLRLELSMIQNNDPGLPDNHACFFNVLKPTKERSGLNVYAPQQLPISGMNFGYIRVQIKSLDGKKIYPESEVSTTYIQLVFQNA